jgi:hypothetical protein
MYLQNLPPDVIWSILDILLVEDTNNNENLPPILIRCAAISRNWRFVSSSHVIWRDSSYWTSLTSRLSLLAGCEIRASRLTKISNVSRSQLLVLVNASRRVITSISICLTWADFTDDIVVNAIARCRNLNDLTITGKVEEEPDIYTFTLLSSESLRILERLRGLKRLSIESSGLSFSIKALCSLLKVNPLEVLNITGEGLMGLVDLTKFEEIGKVSLQLGAQAQLRRKGDVLKQWKLREGKRLVKR